MLAGESVEFIVVDEGFERKQFDGGEDHSSRQQAQSPDGGKRTASGEIGIRQYHDWEEIG